MKSVSARFYKYGRIIQSKRKYSTSEVRERVCIVGSGPAGFYVAQYLLKALPFCSIDIYEKLPAPYGLVRYGVAPDHSEVKNVIHAFERVGTDSRVSYFGNVELGKNLSLQDLKNSYHATVLTYGAASDKSLDIPGDEVANVDLARRFVGWYNGLPSEQNLSLDLSGERVAIIGQGNVALDVARILLKPVDELKNTDITENSLSLLTKSRVKHVTLVGRRGPAQVAFAIKEFREMTKLPIQIKIAGHDCDIETSSLQRPKKRLTELIKSVAKMPEEKIDEKSDKSLTLLFMRTPTRVISQDSKLRALEVAENIFETSDETSPDAKTIIKSKCCSERVECNLILKSIGYRGEVVDPDIKFSRNDCVGHIHLGDSVYCAGWLRTGPKGVLQSTMDNAFETAGQIVKDIETGDLDLRHNKPGSLHTRHFLTERGVQIVDWAGWERIDSIERERGEKLGKPREKIVTISEMLNVCK